MPAQLQPATLLATRSPGFAGRMIRLGSAFRDQPNLVNHIAIVHHTDKHGTVWCLEGRPGGVGWRDARDYIRDPHTWCNAGQALTTEDRAEIVKGAKALIGTAYDWQAIAADGLDSFGLDLELAWQPGPDGVDGHVVCSSLAAYLYGTRNADRPTGDRLVTPGQWLGLWFDRGYARPVGRLALRSIF
jgi:hypothetical protein